MNIFKHLLLLSLLSFSLTNESLSQTTRVDSLLNSIKQQDDDSVKVAHYLDLGLEYLGSDIKRAISYFDEAILLGQKINYQNGVAKAFNAKGRAYAQQGQFQEAILNFQEALKGFNKIKRSEKHDCCW